VQKIIEMRREEKRKRKQRIEKGKCRRLWRYGGEKKKKEEAEDREGNGRGLWRYGGENKKEGGSR
jgi:hypothetical protein